MSHMRRDLEQSAVSDKDWIVAQRLATVSREAASAALTVITTAKTAVEALQTHMINTAARHEITDTDAAYGTAERLSRDAAYQADDAAVGVKWMADEVARACDALKIKLESK